MKVKEIIDKIYDEEYYCIYDDDTTKVVEVDKVENAKANDLNIYNYFKHLLTEIPKHMDDHDASFCEDLLPWSDKLPKECSKQL